MQEKEHSFPGWLRGWQAVDSKVQKLERGLLVVGIFTILIVGTLHVLLRNFLGKGLPFSDVLAQHLTVWLGLIGASLAVSSNEHISIDAFSRVLAGMGLKINKILIGFVSFLGCGILTYRTIVFMQFYLNAKSMEYVHLGTFKLPIWYALLVFPYTFGLLTIRYLMQTIEHIYTPSHLYVAEQVEEDLAQEAASTEATATEEDAVQEAPAEVEGTVPAAEEVTTHEEDKPKEGGDA
ncbi:MAG: TRAP transporter small permease [Deltaproteobacteria bacterium]|nr:MAG: TRAP transporter small permease [Deltaproteobacteria bacterium]